MNNLKPISKKQNLIKLLFFIASLLFVSLIVFCATHVINKAYGEEKDVVETNIENIQPANTVNDFNISFKIEGEGRIDKQSSFSVPEGCFVSSDIPSKDSPLIFKVEDTEICRVTATAGASSIFSGWFINDEKVWKQGIEIKSDTEITVKFLKAATVNFKPNFDDACTFTQDSIVIPAGSECYNWITQMPERHTARICFDGTNFFESVYADRNAGYKFDGWYLNDKLIPAEGEHPVINEDCTIYANFSKVEEVPIHFVVGPDDSYGKVSRTIMGVKSGTMCYPKVQWGRGIIHFDGYSIYEDAVSMPTDSHYQFDGWYLNGEKLGEEGFSVTEEITIVCNFNRYNMVSIFSDDENHKEFEVDEDQDGEITHDVDVDFIYRTGKNIKCQINEKQQLVISETTEDGYDIITATAKGKDGYILDYWKMNDKVIFPGFVYEATDYKDLDFSAFYMKDDPYATLNIYSTNAKHQQFDWNYYENQELTGNGTDSVIVDKWYLDSVISVEESGKLIITKNYANEDTEQMVIVPKCSDDAKFDNWTIDGEKIDAAKSYKVEKEGKINIEVNYKDTGGSSSGTNNDALAQTGDISICMLVFLIIAASGAVFFIKRKQQ